MLKGELIVKQYTTATKTKFGVFTGQILYQAKYFISILSAYIIQLTRNLVQVDSLN